MLVVTIERDGRVISPQGETTIEPGDFVTLLPPDGIDTDVLEIFEGASREEVYPINEIHLVRSKLMDPGESESPDWPLLVTLQNLGERSGFGRI